MSYINDIKKLRYSEDADMKLTRLGVAMTENYHRSSLLEIVMEYFTLCEMLSESLNPELENAAVELDVIHSAVKRIADGDNVAGCIDEFAGIRKIITDKMNIVTAYVDRFLVFEYILDRQAPAFNMSRGELEAEYGGFDAVNYTKELLQYIFGSKDNMVVNERLHEVLECIPVRMSRKKYLGLVESGLNLYEESDKASFDEYVYMLRTSSMLYECKSDAGEFESFAELYEELMNTDYQNLGADHYRILSDKLYNATVALSNMSDVYMCLQKLVNMLYIYALNDSAVEEDMEYVATCRDILAGLYVVAGDEKLDVMSPEEGLVRLEGYMEKLYEEREVLVPLIEEMELAYDDKISELGLLDCYKKLSVSGRLMNGLFADVEDSQYEETTVEYTMAESARLLEDLESLIKNSSRHVVRAVIALTMGKLPMPFTSSDDIKDYILNAFEHCGDKAEIVAVKRMIDDMVISM